MTAFEELADEDPRQVGRYRLLARLGAGGMGRVYLARSPGGRPVAIKVVRLELADDPQFRQRFAREVTAAGRVNSFFTAGVVDSDPQGSPPWLATAYVAGISLGEAIVAHGPWTEFSVRALGAGLVEALEKIHAVGVVHRDLKPSNVLLAPDGPRVIDFGISLAVEDTALTQTGSVVGTPGFMSPEQLTGAAVGPASDVFALGAVLAYTATGLGPFGTGSAHAVNFRAVYEPPELGGTAPGLRELVGRCLEKDPDSRPTVAELLDLLAEQDHTVADAPATWSLASADWLPTPVARHVRERTETAIPLSPPPQPSPQTPDQPADQIQDRPPDQTPEVTAQSEPPAPGAPPTAAPSYWTTVDSPALRTPPAKPRDQPPGAQPQPQPGLSRRGLLAGAGSAMAVAAAGLLAWNLNGHDDDGGGTGSAGRSGEGASGGTGNGSKSPP